MREDRSKQLRLYSGPDGRAAERPAARTPKSRIESLCDAFSRATGRRLQFVSVQDSSALEGKAGADDATIPPWRSPVMSLDGSEGRLCLDADSATTSPDASAAGGLARALAGLLDELSACERALRQREAELATCIPPPLGCENARQFADRLEAVLRGGARALDCQAAAMYLLDDDTVHLKLRAAWGLPSARLADEPRPLAGATADLEALVGHAVVLEDEGLFEFWRVPESGYAAAVCIPISSPTTLLGTLWFFSRAPRSFTQRNTELAEIIAGRLASELERAVHGHRSR